jgi:putative DNA primase/helicase
MSNPEVYEAVTRRMIKALEAGTVPWRKPWSPATGGRPRSMSTRQPYKGINTLLLAVEVLDKGYTSPWWGTYNQVAERAGMERRTNPRTGHQYWVSPDGTPRGVRKGEKGTQIVLWKTGEKTETDPDTGEKTRRQVLLARPFYVFNAEQAEGLPDRYQGPACGGEPADEIKDAQEVLDGYLASGGPTLRHVEGDRAYYTYSTDVITLPAKSQFKTAEGYYATAFHEATHSTAHKDRLAREAAVNFSHDRKWGDAIYARESWSPRWARPCCRPRPAWRPASSSASRPPTSSRGSPSWRKTPRSCPRPQLPRSARWT